MQGEEAGVIAEVMEDAGRGSGQERDHDHGATPPELVGEHQLVRGRELRLDKAKLQPTATRQSEVATQ